VESGGLQSALARHQRLLLASGAVLLLALAGWELWTAFDASFSTPAAAPQAATPSQNTDRIGQITGADLFGRTSAPATANAQQLPETSAQLVLRGVFNANDPQQGSAIIESSDGHAQVVKTGASVAPDTVLREVYDNRVVLARNGAMENLYFPTPQDNGGLPTQNQENAPAETAAPNNPSPPPEGELSADQKRANILRRLEELRMRNSQ